MATTRRTNTRTGRKRRRRPAAGPGRTPIVVGVVVVLVLATAVIGGALWVNAHKGEESSSPIALATAAPDTLDVSLDADTAVVTVGRASAPVTVDLYEDILCPACRQFEQTHGSALHEALDSGAVRVRYHVLNLLDTRSDPPGYSLRAASATLAVARAAPDRFLDFFDSLLAAQPQEGARGYDDEQLVELGRRLGVTGDRFADDLRSGTFEPAIRRGLATAAADPALAVPTANGGRSFGTPTAAVDGVRVDLADPAWLRRLTAGS